MNNQPIDWKLKAETDKLNRQLGFDGLSLSQRKAIITTHLALKSAMENLTECQDLWISDVRELDKAMWAIYHNFNLGDNNTDD